MSKQRILMIVALCFVLIGTVAAGIPHEPKPDSVVGCVAGFPRGHLLRITTLTVPLSIDLTECESEGGALCSPCIRSLESQGCDVLDIDAANRAPGSIFDIFTDALFVLSCERP